MPSNPGSAENPPPSRPEPPAPEGYARAQAAIARLRRFGIAGILAGLRIRFKLILLHTVFSLALAAILVVALRPAIGEVVKQAESHEAGVLLSVVLAELERGGSGSGESFDPKRLETLAGPGVSVRVGSSNDLGLESTDIDQVQRSGRVTIQPVSKGEKRGGVPESWWGISASPVVVGKMGTLGEDRFVGVSVTLPSARDAVVRLYVLMTFALLAVYAFVAAALEIFVLPQHVYQPIRTLLMADEAVREGRTEDEIIPESSIPRDELGEIMRSRNSSVIAMRMHERALAEAAWRLEEVATDLKRKNHLLEMARQNMADADRLASLGLMSAGIAHELNTPLAVLKGMVEKINRGAKNNGTVGNGGGGGTAQAVSPEEAALMLRVVGRLERLSEGLLDFARVRPPKSTVTIVRALVDEAWTLVRLDREARDVELVNDIPDHVTAYCDGDRIVQVLVNLLRNAVDAFTPSTPQPRIVVAARPAVRDQAGDWVSITIVDNGPGIDAETLSRLFQPFVSTRLDSKGTGLGLAVAEGIVREHGGMLLARNRFDTHGAVFEIVLPEQSMHRVHSPRPAPAAEPETPIDPATTSA